MFTRNSIVLSDNIKTPLTALSKAVGNTMYTSVEYLARLIKALFTNPEQGFAYDPNDLSTMWQDQAKLLPVTDAGQPVWHILDKSGNNNHAFATSSATRPLLQRNATTGAYYLAFDGADDFLVTNSIDFTATDKVSLFAGVRKFNTSLAVIFELGVAVNNATGTFNISCDYVGSSPHSYSLGSNGGVFAESKVVGYNAPTSNVIIGKASIRDDSITVRVDGVQKGTVYADQGTGNYGSYPIYIGRRAGSLFPFNGHLYSLIGIGRLTSDSETIALEKSIAKNTGVTLSV